MTRRRQWLLGTVALLATLGRTGVPRAAPAKAPPLLSPDEPAAKAIAYVEYAARVDTKAFPSFRRGQSCLTCKLLRFGTGRARACDIVPDRLVLATGWCKLWVPRGR